MSDDLLDIGVTEIDDFINNNNFVRIHSKIDARRELASDQIKSDETKSKLCDVLRKAKMANAGLTERVYNLQYSDMEMFKYIQKLEFVQDGIWCPTCNKIKKIGGKPAQTCDVTDVKNEKNIKNEKNEKIQKLSDDVSITKKHINKLNMEYNTKMNEIRAIVSALETELKFLQNTDQTSLESLNTVKKEDLPGCPDCPDFAQNIEKTDVMSSNELLDAL